MRTIDLPGPLVFQPQNPADAETLYGGMTVSDMIDAVTAIDPACGLVAAFTGRYIASHLRDHPETMYADDPQTVCCAGAISLLTHRLDTRHVLNLYVQTLTDAVNTEITARIADGEAAPDQQTVFDDVIGNMEEVCAELTDILVTLISQNPIDLLWCVPLLALAVPTDRIDAYWDAQMTWPEVLTFETYGPPRAEDLQAALTPPAVVINLDDHRPQRHLYLVR